MLFQGIDIAPVRYGFVLLLGGLLVKRFRIFLLAWIPFLFVLFSYDFLRSFTGFLYPQAHITETIYLDSKIFGVLPTIILQNTFYTPGHLSWYDFLGTFMYFLHFIIPVSFGFILWNKNINYFREFVTAFALLSYAAFVTYIIFPAIPPWMASQQGYISGVTKINDAVLNSFIGNFNLATIYHNLNPDPIAIIPSVHAAFPFMIFLFAWRYFRYKALWFLPYVLFIWFFLIYSGEHYVIDVLIGILYAVIFFLISTKFLHRINWRPFFQRIPILNKLNV